MGNGGMGEIRCHGVLGPGIAHEGENAMQWFAIVEALIAVTVACAGLYFLTVGAATGQPIKFLAGLAAYCAAWLYGLFRASYIPDPNPH